MADLVTFVHLTDEDGVSRGFGPGDEVPAWAVEKITNPDVWAGEAPSVEVEAPAKPRASRTTKAK